MKGIKRKKFPRPKARKILLSSVVDFLKQKGYSVIKIWRPWRHVVAVVEKNDKKLFFKMASTVKTGKKTANEFSWNELVNPQLSSDSPFLVPKNIEKGYFQNRLFFFIEEYFGDQRLAEKYPPRTKELDKWILKIAQAACLISKIDSQADVKQKERPIGGHLWESASEWSSQLKSNTKPLLKVISQARQQVKRSLNHGDFVPWHMYDLEGRKFGLVDAEHSGFGAKYYDVAYFYTRVRQSLGGKELARKFLLEFRNLLSKRNKSTFWPELKPVLAQRLIGDFWGAEIGPKIKEKEELKKCEEFKKDLLKDKIM